MGGLDKEADVNCIHIISHSPYIFLPYTPSRYSVGRITTQASAREMATSDFELKVKQFFPHDGSDM